MEKVKLAQEISDIDNSDIETKKDKRMRRDKIKEDYNSSSDEQENYKKIDDSIFIPLLSLLSSFIINQPESSSTSFKILKPKLSRSSPAVNESTFDNSCSDSFNS